MIFAGQENSLIIFKSKNTNQMEKKKTSKIVGIMKEKKVLFCFFVFVLFVLFCFCFVCLFFWHNSGIPYTPYSFRVRIRIKIRVRIRVRD